MFRLALRTLRFRKGGFVASFIVLFFGTMIVLACGGLMETGIRTTVPPQRLAAAPIVVAGDPDYTEGSRLDTELVAEIEAVPGVARAVPDVSFPLAPLRDGRPVSDEDAMGYGWASAGLAPYTVSEGGAPAGPGEVVLDTRIAALLDAAVGDQVAFAISGAAQHFRVTGIADGPATGSNAAFFTNADARQLARDTDTVDLIGVFPAPGTDIGELRQRIGDTLSGRTAVTLTGDERGLAEFDGAQQGGGNLIVMSGVFGGLAVMVAMFVVASTLGLSVQQRQREMALLRAIGSTPGQLRRMILGEALVIVVLAATLAYLPNRYVGEWLLDQLTGAGIAPSAILFHQGWIPLVAGFGVALLSALGAAYIAGRMAARTRPTEALAEASLQRRWLSWVRLLFAVLCLAGGLALTLVTALAIAGPAAEATAGPTAMLWAAGLALLGPGVTGALTAVLQWPLRAVTGLSGQLARLNAGARKVRMAGAVIPIMLVTGLAAALLYIQTSKTSVAQQALTENLRADAVVGSAAGGFPVDFVETVREQPGVVAASALVPSSAHFPQTEFEDEDEWAAGGERVPVQGLSAEGADATVAVRVADGSLEDLRGDTVALPTAYAEDYGVGVGDTVRLRLGDGTDVKPTVVAVFDARVGYESLLMPASLVVDHSDSGLVPQILVRTEPGSSPRQLASTLDGLAQTPPGLRVTGRDEAVAAQAEQEQTGIWVNYLLVAVLVGYAVISLVNTLVIATGERRREFALQRLIGSTRGQVMRMMVTESILVTVVGIVLGTAIALATVIPFNVAIGNESFPGGPLWIYLAVVGSTTALALTTTMLSTMYTLRARPVEAAAAQDD